MLMSNEWEPNGGMIDGFGTLVPSPVRKVSGGYNLLKKIK